jgi:hypothetical protein
MFASDDGMGGTVYVFFYCETLVGGAFPCSRNTPGT